jgi:hypothetical protein
MNLFEGTDSFIVPLLKFPSPDYTAIVAPHVVHHKLKAVKLMVILELYRFQNFKFSAKSLFICAAPQAVESRTKNCHVNLSLRIFSFEMAPIRRNSRRRVKE